MADESPNPGPDLASPPIPPFQVAEETPALPSESAFQTAGTFRGKSRIELAQEKQAEQEKASRVR